MSIDELRSLSEFEFPEEPQTVGAPGLPEDDQPPRPRRSSSTQPRRRHRRVAVGPWYRSRGFKIGLRIGGFLLALLWILLIGGTLILRGFGYEPLVVRTSSMEPTVDAGDLMIAKARTDPVEVGAIYVGLNPTTGAPTAHRVMGPGPDPDTWVTKGDNNDAADEYFLPSAELDRQIVGWVPFGGYVNNFLAQPLIRILMFAAPILLFAPPLIRAFRTPKPHKRPVADAEDGFEEDEEPVVIRIGPVDKVVSIAVALGIFVLLGARMYYGFVPVVVGETGPESTLTSGSMAITQMQPVAGLEPGEVIQIISPEQIEPTLQQLVVPPEDPTQLPPEPGNRYIATVDALNPIGATITRMQMPEASELPQVVFEGPYLGRVLPVLATAAGFGGLLVFLGLLATLLAMRVLLSTGNTHSES